MDNCVFKYNTDNKLKICNNVLEVIYKYRQIGRYSREKGGVLIGKENNSNSNLIINDLTKPMFNDICFYNRFLRKDKKHVNYFNKLYTKSNDTCRYMGEWHTHPEQIPNYSTTDFDNWKKICTKSPTELDFIHIIVGIQAFRVWSFSCTNREAELTATIWWKDL